MADRKMESKKKVQTQNTSKDLKTALLNKILELQGSSLDAKELIGTLITFAQSLLGIDTVAIYANFANHEINLINSSQGTKQYTHLGHLIELIAESVDVQSPKYYNSLIPASELNIKNLSEAEENTYIYPIVSPNARQIYGVVLLTNLRLLPSNDEYKILLFVLNYITKIIEEADLSFQVDSKDSKLRLLSELSASLRGMLKADKAIEIVLDRIYKFLNLDDIYFARWISAEKRLEINHEIVFDEKHTLKGFNHKVSKNNPLIKLLMKNQHMTYNNKNVKKISRVFLGRQEPSIFCLMPVIIRNELLGTIICISTKPNAEASIEDVRVVLDIAGQLAVILNQSNLYEESLSTAQREFLLNSITTMIRDTLEVRGVLEKTAREIGQVFGVNACGAFICKEGETAFNTGSIWATKKDFEEKLAAIPLVENTPFLPDPIMQSISMPDVNITDLGEYQELIKTIGLKSYLACSLLKGDKVAGVLVLGQFEHPREWTSSEVQLLEAITDQVEMAISQAELHEHLQRAERQMNLLHQVSAAIRDSLDLSNVMARTAQDLGEIMSTSRCFIRRLSSVQPLKILATEKEYISKNQELNKAADLILEFEQEWLESINDLPDVERASAILHIEDVMERYKNATEPLKSILETIKLKSFLGIPLVAAGQVIGCLCIHQCDRNRRFTQNEIDFAGRVAAEASIAVLNADLFAKVQHEAQRDGLTGLYNQSYFKTALHHEVERAKRTGSDLSVIMIDLDYLKKFNDTYGHKAGDEAIMLVAGKMEQCLRQMDIIARLGGDEFAALLPETKLDDAEKIAKRILDTLSRTQHSCGDNLSASIGVAGTPHEERSKEAILKAMDESAYVSKREGRNRVTSSTKLDELGHIEKKPIARNEEEAKNQEKSDQ